MGIIICCEEKIVNQKVDSEANVNVMTSELMSQKFAPHCAWLEILVSRPNLRGIDMRSSLSRLDYFHLQKSYPLKISQLIKHKINKKSIVYDGKETYDSGLRCG